MMLLTAIMIEAALLTAILVEPFYRLVYGRPLPSLAQAEQLGDGPQGLVVALGGVGGLDLCGVGERYVLASFGYPYAVEVFKWGHGFGRWYKDLVDVANHEAQARKLADLVRGFKERHPGSPVYLVAQSGGSGLVVRALEQFDPRTIERVVLLSPALSPRYDLTLALRAVRRDVVVFWSPLDVIVLGLGTRLFGTMDRVWTVSAGLVGFKTPRRPPGLAPGLAPYDRLRQVKWRLAMAATGNLGGHLGPNSPRFLTKYVAPLLRLEIPGVD